MVVVAQFAGSHGVRGAFKIRSFTDDPEAVFAYGSLRTEDGQSLTPKKVREVKPSLFLVQAKEITSPEACEAFKGALLSVPRASLPATEDEDDFYVEDLIGLAVLDQEGHAVGTVKAVPNYGAGDIVEIQTSGKPLLLPFTKEAVPQVDLALGVIIVVVPEEEDDETAANDEQSR